MRTSIAIVLLVAASALMAQVSCKVAREGAGGVVSGSEQTHPTKYTPTASGSRMLDAMSPFEKEKWEGEAREALTHPNKPSSVQLDPVILEDGVPNFGAVSQKDSLFFIAHAAVHSMSDVFSWEIWVISGNARMYITTDDTEPTPNNYDYTCGAQNPACSLDIKASDKKFSPNMFLAVYGVLDAAFLVSYTSSSEPVELLADVPYQATILDGYQYFKFYNENPNLVGINIIPIGTWSIQHEPTLFGSTTVEAPDKTNHMWEVDSTYSKDLRIGTDDSNYCYTCWYYFSVLAPVGASSSFRITAISEPPVATNLEEGQLEVTGVDAGETVYFHAKPNVASGKSYMVHLVIADGTLTLFANNDGTKPTPTTHKYECSTSAPNSCTITVTSTGNDLLEIGIYNKATDAALAAVAWEQPGDELSLIDGVPVAGSVQAGQFDYYVFTPQNGANVMCDVYALQGDPDLYAIAVPHGDKTKPTTSHYTWRDTNVGHAVMSITHSDPNYCGVCNYVFGVYGFGNPADYVITVVANETSPGVLTKIEGPVTTDITEAMKKMETMRNLRH